MESVLQFKKANCKNCYKCIRNCPVKAIEVKEHQAQIIDRECIYCGKCTQVCPQNAKNVRSDVDSVRALLAEGKHLVASVAPSFIAHYPVQDFAGFSAALKSLGFSDAQETASGAYLVKTEYERLMAEHWNQTIISSCCPTIVQLIEKHYPQALSYLAPVLSPMQAHGQALRKQYPDAILVFIGPCIAKKDECQRYPGYIDYVLTFDELNHWLSDDSVSFPTEADKAASPKRLSRFFPVSGGILKTMAPQADYQYVCVDEVESCMQALEEILSGSLSHCFVEMSACKGSCIQGPATGHTRPLLLEGQKKVAQIAAPSGGKAPYEDFSLAPAGSLVQTFEDLQYKIQGPTEEELSQILLKMGKKNKEDELNCGTCGYSTCRDKAVAIYFGKADISMCLPYMKERAESVADEVITASPNAVITVDIHLNIQLINPAACALFGVVSPQDMIGRPIGSLMDEFDFVSVFAGRERITRKKVYLPEYQKYMDQTFLYEKNSNLVICILNDRTAQEQSRERLRTAKINAADMTDQIIEKQMRVVHELASLLGETAAETKVAMLELKKAVMMEEDLES